jgi:hypothetical protein
MAETTSGPRKEDRRVSTRKTKFECPHCQGPINDAFMLSWGQTLLSAKAKGACKVRSSEAMARAARIRWEKYWEQKGGRPSWYPPLPQINATGPPSPKAGRRRPRQEDAAEEPKRKVNEASVQPSAAFGKPLPGGGISFGPFLTAKLPSDSPSGEDFGPFIATGGQLIQPAGWKCKECGKPVRYLKQATIPSIIERLVVYACDCGASVHWESERQASRKNWPALLELLKATGCQIAICNSGKDTPPGFSGTN